MRIFRHEIEVTLKMVGVVTLLGLIVLPAAWGYEQRRQARAWRNVACTYRIKEVTRSLAFVAANIERTPDPCAALARLGLDVSVEPEFVVLPTRTASVPGRPR
jgi:hypothetical protein